MAFDMKLPDGCPADDAGEFDGVAFRVVKTNPPTDIDLLTHLEKQLAPSAPPCKRASISLFARLEQAQHLADMRPHLGTFVSSITLTAAHGRVGAANASGHIDWWPYEGMRRLADLAVIEQ